MTKNKLRWGILGAAEIARKNWKAIALAGNSTVVAVASRDLERSRRFIAECQSEAPMEAEPKALANYEELIASDRVDAVYVPLPTGVRKEWVVRAANHGKHVVCEKPCALTVSDLEEMLAACKRNKVQFMDGVMFVHSRRFERLREVLQQQRSIGTLKRIESAFSFYGAADFCAGNIRMHSELEPLGCLGDLGWYCIRLALWLMDWQLPREINGRLLAKGKSPDSPASVPTDFSGELLFDGGVTAGFYCSFTTELQQWAMIAGTRGYVEIPDFVLPFAGKELGFELRQSAYHIRGCDFRMETARQLISVPEPSHGEATAQEANCFRNFSAQVLSGRLNGAWPEAALKTQIVMNACWEKPCE